MPLPLEGVRVLDLTRILAGPYATMKLADMGAEVPKVEIPVTGDDTRKWGPPFANGEATYFIAVNRNKRSLTLNLKSPRAKEVLERLIKQSDVLLENFRPGTLADLGFPWEQIRALNPRIVYCAISGYGQEGKYRDKASYDVIVQGECGVMELTGQTDGPPTKVGLSIADQIAGMLATEGVLLALFRREKTGQGDRVDISLLDGMLSMMTYQAQMWLSAGQRPKRMGNRHPSIVPYETFQAKDVFMNVGVANEALWRRFCEAIGRADLAADERFDSNEGRVRNREALIPTIQAILRGKEASHWLAAFEAAGIPCGLIRDLEAVCEAAEADSREMIVEADHPAGNIRMVGNPVKLESARGKMKYVGPPRLGQHTNAILRELGFSEDEIDALRTERAV